MLELTNICLQFKNTIQHLIQIRILFINHRLNRNVYKICKVERQEVTD